MDSGHLGLNHIKVGNVWQILFNWSHVPAMSSFFRTLYTYKNTVGRQRNYQGFLLFNVYTVWQKSSGVYVASKKYDWNSVVQYIVVRLLILCLFQRLKNQSTKYRTEKTYPSKMAENQQNFKKNRYKDIVPCKCLPSHWKWPLAALQYNDWL